MIDRKEKPNMTFGTGKYSYELMTGWAKYPKDWSIRDVAGLTIDSQDRVYVFNRGPHPLMIFDPEGNLLTTWGEGLFKRAHGSCIGPDGSIYCTDDENHTISKFTPEGRLLMTLGTMNQPSDTGYVRKFDSFASLATITKGGSPFNRPTGVALSSSGNIFVSDGYGNARVHKFSSDGKLLHSWGQPGPNKGQFRLPHSIWVDKKDNVWIVDRENSRIQKFNAQGEYLTQWIHLIRPTGLFIDDEDIVYISDLAQRISIYTIDGELISQWGTDGLNRDKALFHAPHTIAVDSRGDLYVGEVAWTYTGIDKGSSVIQKFTRKR